MLHNHTLCNIVKYLNTTPRTLFGFLFLTGIVAGLIVVLSFLPIPLLQAIDDFQKSLPVITEEDYLLRQSIYITDRNGHELFKTYHDEDRTFLTLDKVPPVVYNAFIAIEDERFYERPCIDFRAIARAAYRTYFLEDEQGGSTISQQLARAITNDREITIQRKVRELFAACSLEQDIGKTGVLEQYLNRINFGGTLYGIQSASNAYFGIPAEELNIARAAILASIIQRPSYYAPGGNIKTVPDRAYDVVEAMFRLGFITRKEYKEAKDDLPLITFAERTSEDLPPFPFVFETLNRTHALLAAHNLSDAAKFSGLTIQTTLDLEVQEKVEETIRSVFPEISARTFAKDVAAVVLDRESRDVLAYIGNSDWGGNPNTKWVDLATEPRQLGSAFKPIVYAAYFENGKTPDSFISDTPLQIGTMKPKNFEGGFLGKMSVRKAIAWSRNIPAIRAFLDIGEDRVLKLASAMGAPTPLLMRDQKRLIQKGFSFGWPMAIGSAELPLMELVQVYGTIAEGGVSSPTRTISSIQSADGKVIYKPPEAIRKQVLQPKNAAMLSSVLRDWSARPERWNLAIELPKDWKIGLKTGTSNLCRIRKFDGNCAAYSVLNTVAVGFTDRYIIGVLVTNADNTPLQSDADGLNAAVPVWTAIIRRLADR